MAQFTLPDGHNYFVDSAGRILIFSCGIDGAELKDPRTLTKTTGKVLPSSNTCIDDARWQYIRNTLAPSSDNWRLGIATTDSTNNLYGNSSTNERSILLTASARNIARFRLYNVRALPSSLTDWLYRSEFSGGGSVTFIWDEDSGSDGVGLDYSGIIFQSAEATPASSYRGFGVYSQSSRPGFGAGQYSYFHRNLEFWILPPGVADFPTEEGYRYQLDGNGLSHNPGDPASNHQYGWFTRSGGTVTNPVGGGSKPFQGDCRQLVLVWNGVVIFDSIDSPVIVAPASGNSNDFISWAGAGTSVVGRNGYSYPMGTNCGVVVGNYVYYPGTFQGSSYGWPNSGIGYSASSPNGDQCNGFQIKRRRYFPSTPTYTGNKSNGQTSTVPSNATNIYFDVNGARGGFGAAGARTGTAYFPAVPGGYGQRTAGYINPQNINLSFTHYLGGNGNNGSGTSRGSAGTGGVNSGGAGGYGQYESSDTYGGGGAGGGASSGLYSNTLSSYITIAGGGGGGGGNMWFDFSYYREAVPRTTFNISSSPSRSNGSTGGTASGGSFNAGGGGGGGGASGGDGGAAYNAGNSIAGQGGKGGAGFGNSDYAETSYIIPDWVGTTYWPQTATDQPTDYNYGIEESFTTEFGSLSRNSNWRSSSNAELYYYTLNAQSYADEVGIRLKLYTDGSWTQVKEMYIKDAGTWKLVQDCYIKKDGSWSPFYG